LPNYVTGRRQTLLLRIPEVPAADYMRQVGDALAIVLADALTRPAAAHQIGR
jgi:hypothetical protein